MDFLKPPTDNLYKFLALSGLILFLISITWPPWFINKLKLSTFEVEKDQGAVQHELDQAELEYQQWTKAVNRNDIYTKDLIRQVDELLKQQTPATGNKTSIKFGAWNLNARRRRKNLTR